MLTALVWLLSLLCAGWAGVRLAGAEGGWPGVALISLTPYAGVLALAAALLALLLGRKLAALVGLAAAALLAGLIAPRATGEPGRAGGPELRVLSANVHHGDVPPEALVALARRTRADVLSVQELTPAHADGLRRARLAGLLPYRVEAPRAGAAGTGLYARQPLTPLPALERTSFAMVAAALDPPDAPPVRLMTVHARAPLARGSTARWRDELRRLPGAPPRGPVQLLAGDFNATLDHAELRDLLGRGYRDAADAVGAGLQPTWRGRLALPLTVDHVLVPERVAVRAVDVIRLPSSDHRAVLAVLRLPRG